MSPRSTSRRVAGPSTGSAVPLLRIPACWRCGSRSMDHGATSMAAPSPRRGPNGCRYSSPECRRVRRSSTSTSGCSPRSKWSSPVSKPRPPPVAPTPSTTPTPGRGPPTPFPPSDTSPSTRWGPRSTSTRTAIRIAATTS